MDREQDQIMWKYLTTADNEFEFNIIKGKLEENGIVCVGKGKDLGLIDSTLLNVILGPCVPIEIKVPEDRYQEALEIINTEVSEEELEKQALDSGKNEQENEDNS
ncbi:DUF2007 domain-containing protein [Ruminiclostridium cellulolyticum]|uniref:DUF2007 domain-containing protein n=1 Tax=Ruminiclostridium cellulolyticum (strain ATCC 35319 / DSM 5812 / JCM 6584 / H10) TaxID=394503 RepID=B8I4B1_RUMCH|nr:DUF2007 domain-containing protein [Ruminiclostridium cellulolyticum]ACL74465.1 hypothetical protein Ccel_0077 [Ruminiclostridium cellulolyticum H10]